MGETAQHTDTSAPFRGAANGIAPNGFRGIGEPLRVVEEVQPNGNGAAIATGVATTLDHSPAMRILKRAFDLVAASILIVVGAPFLLAIALLIKFDSRGPVLFRQDRVGRHGEVFGMLKFRTMVQDAERLKQALMHLNEAPDGLFKISSDRDPRTTRVGAFLRATSLDELPQLLHVLAGQMSLVGPRPLVPEEDALVDGSYRQRLEMRPGMTGPWQVAGASRIPLRDMVHIDAEYVGGWTLGGDLRLLAKTVPHVVLRRGI